MSASLKRELAKKGLFNWNHRQLGAFFQKHRLAAGLALSTVALELDLKDASVLNSFEEGTVPIPLEMVFTLTNLYNIPPEETLLMMCDLRESLP